ncbi:peroxisomal assembly protein [Dispira simplex]|nr:peroxisomal assembly protein [Dispira simplex]
MPSVLPTRFAEEPPPGQRSVYVNCISGAQVDSIVKYIENWPALSNNRRRCPLLCLVPESLSQLLGEPTQPVEDNQYTAVSLNSAVRSLLDILQRPSSSSTCLHPALFETYRIEQFSGLAEALGCESTTVDQCWVIYPEWSRYLIHTDPLLRVTGTIEAVCLPVFNEVVLSTSNRELYQFSQRDPDSVAEILCCAPFIMHRGGCYTFTVSHVIPDVDQDVHLVCRDTQPVQQGRLGPTTRVVLALDTRPLGKEEQTPQDYVQIDTSYLRQNVQSKQNWGLILDDESEEDDPNILIDDPFTTDIIALGSLTPISNDGSRQSSSSDLGSFLEVEVIGTVCRLAIFPDGAFRPELEALGQLGPLPINEDDATYQRGTLITKALGIDYSLDCVVIVSFATLGALGMQQGDWISVHLLANGTWSRSDATTIISRPCRIVAIDWPQLITGSEGLTQPTVWVSSLLAFNLGCTPCTISQLVGSIASRGCDSLTTRVGVRVTPWTGWSAAPGCDNLNTLDQVLPPATELTLTRIASPISENKILYEGFLDTLQRYLSSAGTLVLATGDLIGVALDRTVAHVKHEFLEEQHQWSDVLVSWAEDNLHWRGTLAFFRVSRLVTEESSEDLANATYHPNYHPDFSRVHPTYTKIVQTGLESGYVPYGWARALGIRLTPSPPWSRLNCFQAFNQALDIVQAYLDPATQHLGLPTTLLVQGAGGSGKTTTLNWVAECLGLHQYIVSVSELTAHGTSVATMHAALETHFQQAAKYAPCLMVLDHIDALGQTGSESLEQGQDPPMVHVLRDLVKQSGNSHSLGRGPPWGAENVVVVVGTCTDKDSLPPALATCFQQEVNLAAPPEGTRLAILEACLDGLQNTLDYSLRTLALETASFLPGDLVQLTNRACWQAWTRSKSLQAFPSDQFIQGGNNNPWRALLLAGISLSSVDWTEAIQETRAEVSDGLGVPKIPNVSWDDVGGLQSVKQTILETVQLPLEHPELFAQGVKKRSGILLYGPPGTGKTLLAKAVATSCALNFFSVKGPELLNMYIGESEANVRRVFQKARDARPCVIFFDELDSLAPKRGQQGDSGGVMDRIVSQLLAELDGMSSDSPAGGNNSSTATTTAAAADIFVIGATNRPDLLDPALLRPGRFDKLIYLGISETHESQCNIMTALTRKFRLHPTLDLSDIAERCPFNYTGADFYALCSDAMLKAMVRQVSAIDQKVAQINLRNHPVGTLTKEEEKGDTDRQPTDVQSLTLTPQYYLEHSATDEDINVVVTKEDFLQALEELVPSVSVEELARYQTIRGKFNQPNPTTLSSRE